MKKIALLLTITTSACGLQLNAQEIEKENELNPVTVTASMIRQRASETGRNITVIKGEQFRQLPVHSLDELLRYLPGVEIQARGPMGSQSDIVLRGGTFQQVLVILDGMRLNDPNTGHFNSYIPIAPAEIERIEVLKGASSAIHGPDAVGGVINIITKSFAAQKGAEALQLSASTGAGEYGLWNADAGFLYSKNRLTLAGGVLHNQADGVQQRGTTGFFNNTTASVSANYHLSSKWNVAYRFAYDNRDFAAQNYYTTFLSDTASEEVTSRWHQLRIGYQDEQQSLSLDAGFKSVSDHYKYNNVSIANNSTSRLFQSRLIYQRKLSSSTNLVAGANLMDKNIESNDRGNHSLLIVSPFVSLSQSLWKGFTVRPSLQWVFFGSISNELAPQIDISQKAGQFQLRGSVGKTIRDADFTERYNNYNKALVTSGRIGNPNLNSETSVSYEAGADWFYGEHLKLSATFFQRYHKSLIDYSNTAYADMPRKDNLSPSGTYALAKNISSVETTGWETDVQYIHPFSAQHKLTASLGLVWLSSESSESTPSFYISSHAKLLTNFSVIWSLKNLSLSVNGMYKKREKQNLPAINATVSRDYFLINGRAQYAFWKQRLGVFVQVDNAFDQSYSDLLGTPMPGRWLMGGLQVRWSK
ncbi:TonB-dependent receptor plug domain-containing protein [Pseudobacter ginsenosidimutans]|uniref:Iron complex outermembrane receptor protein n=1 Tax=Pseudobacter ginsenosidimutans TaxID=661488 RepID=A0A4Q7N5W6_9BACT|nr:TonB-dependent receptor [Pseudobacter ginsenosidimutans]QEC44961.1 TonB-dependent receptor [Pseudobacter ginsenosidimutans]RZS76455.1 iron complex outermembrane receptor protein [Pseudobacter ginsenosidimutans]